MVWQRYTGYSGGQHKYDTYFSKNTGSGWSTNTITNLSNLGFSAQSNPLPVITYCANENGVYRQLVCARTSSRIKYVTSTTDGSSWSSATLIPDASASHQNPSLSMGPTTPQVMVYLAYDDGSNIYYNSYSAFSGTWYGSQTNISTGSGTSNNKYPSVEKDDYQYGGKNFAWQGYSPAIMADVIVHRRDTGPFQMFETGNSAARPSITGHQSGQRSLVFYDSISKYVYRAYYNGSSWSQTQVSYNGAHPNISAGTTTAKYLWTAGSSSPYNIAIGSEVLPTGGLFKLAAGDMALAEGMPAKPIPLIYHRSAVVQDTSLASLFWAEVGEIVMTTLQGDTIPIEFVGIDADSIQVTAQNVCSYLETAPFKIPSDVATLSWQQNLYGLNLTPLQISGANSPGVAYQLIDASEAKVLATLAQARFSDADAESRITGSESADLSGYQGREVKLRVQSQGLNDKAAGIVAGVVELYRIDRSQLGKKRAPGESPQQAASRRSYQLEQNYPNPFNPETAISYQISDACHVTLKIYNLRGQQVKTVVDHDAPAGSHTVRWDGKDEHGHDLASGIYVYRLEAGAFAATKKLALVR